MKTMLTKLKQLEILTDPKLEEVMLKVDRSDYCPKRPYNDEEIDIGCNSTIPEVRDHIRAL